jgi:polyhydroxybutyrate depolymerase
MAGVSGGRAVRVMGVLALSFTLLSLTACSSDSSGSSTANGGSPRATTGTTRRAPRTAMASAGCRPPSASGSTEPASGSTGGTVTGRGQLVVGAATRTYQLVVPSPPAAHTRPAPLIILFHGFNGSGAQIADYTRLPAQAAAAGYVVASPNGTAKTWQLDAHGTDAGFVTALIVHLEASRCIDRRRVYLAGFSAGAAFAILYGCQHQREIAALATVAVDFQLGCTRPMPIVAFHGTLDPLVPFVNGGLGASLPGVAVRGTELNMGDWARLDRCGPAPVSVALGSQVTRRRWPGCGAGTDVVLYRIEGGGHTWPGAVIDDGGGLTTHQIGASRLIVAFFDQHPAPS